MSDDPSILNRLMFAIRRIIKSEFANYTYMGIYEYSIQNVDLVGLIDADPTDTALGLPSIGKMQIRPSPLGETVKPRVGHTCHVMFVNGKPTRPVIISIFGASETATITSGDLSFQCGVQLGNEHVLTTQQFFNMMTQFWVAVNNVLGPGPISGAAMGSSPANLIPVYAAMIPLAISPVTGIIDPATKTLIDNGVKTKLPNVTGLVPGIGCPNVKAG